MILFLFGGMALVGFLLLKPEGMNVYFGRRPITQADLAKLKSGMTPAQVQAILGKPTEDVTNSAGQAMFAAMSKDENVMKFPAMRTMMWTDEKNYAAVVCFLDDREFAHVWHDGPPDRRR